MPDHPHRPSTPALAKPSRVLQGLEGANATTKQLADDRALFYLEAEAAHNARIEHLDNMVETMSRKNNDSATELLQRLATLQEENQRLEYELKMAMDVGQMRHKALSSQLDLAKKQLHDITKTC